MDRKRGGLDYVLKPFDRERFSAALARVRARRATGEQEELSRRLSAVFAELQRAQGHAQRLLVRSEGRIRLVGVDDVDWIEAADNYARLHVGAERHLIRETMGGLEARLDPARFRPDPPLHDREPGEDPRAATDVQRRVRRLPQIGREADAEPRVPGCAAAAAGGGLVES
jgi:hypothetical protein